MKKLDVSKFKSGSECGDINLDSWICVYFNEDLDFMYVGNSEGGLLENSGGNTLDLVESLCPESKELAAIVFGEEDPRPRNLKDSDIWGYIVNNYIACGLIVYAPTDADVNLPRELKVRADRLKSMGVDVNPNFTGNFHWKNRVGSDKITFGLCLTEWHESGIYFDADIILSTSDDEYADDY